MVSSTNRETYSPVHRTGNSESHPPAHLELDGNLTNEEYPFRRGVKDHWYDYCSTNGIHGTCYLAQNRTWIEIIVWIIIILVSCGGCFYMINEIYQKYLDSPVIISVASQQARLSDIPLPAITICPWGIVGSKCFEESYKRRFSPEEMKIREQYAKMLCKMNPTELSSITANEDATKILDFLDECAPQLKIQCAQNIEDCSSSWTKTFTSEGVCYSFNMLDRSELYNDKIVHFKNYSVFQKSVDWDFSANSYYDESKAPKRSYPFRALYKGIQNGLTIMISQIDEPYGICKNYVKGFKTMLHMPTRVPYPDEDSFYVRGNKSVMASIYPSTVRTSSVVRKYPIGKRNCVFQGEVPLVHYRSYSEKNCVLDELTNLVLESAGCTMFWMPRSLDKSNKSCSSLQSYYTATTITRYYKMLEVMDQTDLDDNEDIKKNMTTIPDDIMKKVEINDMDAINAYIRYIMYDVLQTVLSKVDTLKNKLERCLPSCTDVTYDVDVIPYSLDMEQLFKELSEDDSDDLDDPQGLELHSKSNSYMTSGVQLYFKSKSVSTMERNELYGVSDFISNFGGLLGLFTGFSLISGIEIVYFLSLRLWANRKLYNYWAIPGTGDPR